MSCAGISHSVLCYTISRLRPKGHGVALNNDDVTPDGLDQAGSLLCVCILACTTLSAFHYKLIERGNEIERQGIIKLSGL